MKVVKIQVSTSMKILLKASNGNRFGTVLEYRDIFEAIELQT